MKLRNMLATGTALALLATSGVALGDSNQSAVVQSGNNNSTGIAQSGSQNTTVVKQTSNSNAGDITQSGSSNVAKFTQTGLNNNVDIDQIGIGNWAGTHMLSGGMDPFDAASGYNYMVQSGDNNSLKIAQDLKGNSVAVDGQVVQSGDRNVIDITQHGGASSGGKVNTITQTDSTGSAAAMSNKVTILQAGAAGGAYAPGLGAGSSDYNYAVEFIGTVTQTNPTAGLANILSLTQTGGVYNAGNTINSVSQIGANNSGTVTQSGRLNRLATQVQTGNDNLANVIQTGTSNLVTTLTQTGTLNNATVSQIGVNNAVVSLIQDNSSASTSLGNIATLSFTGNDNGVGLFSGNALNVGLTLATISQRGDLNALTYTVSTNANLFAFRQAGDGNTISGTVSGGNANQVAVSQTGNGNTTSFTQIGGANNLAVIQ